VYYKKVLLASAFTVAAIAIGVSTLVVSNGSPANSRVSANPRVERPEVGPGEIAATLPLFNRVDDNYLRGSQPLRGGIGTLKRLGVNTLVDLRSIYDHADDIKAAAEVAGLGYEWVPMSVWNPPSDDEARRFVSLVADTSRGPFFVFCADGLNRVGEMTAIYRVAHSKWTVEKALHEADELGFNPYYYNLRSYVWDYARKFNPAAVPPAGRRVSTLEP